MYRLSMLASWFFICLAVNLAVISMLAVPRQARADDACGTCCEKTCEGDPTCTASCYPDCYNGKGPCGGQPAHRLRPSTA